MEIEIDPQRRPLLQRQRQPASLPPAPPPPLPPLPDDDDDWSARLYFALVASALLALFYAFNFVTVARPASHTRPSSSPVPPPRRAAPTILISLDGFRHDYLHRTRRNSSAPLAPTLTALARAGVRATAGMQPVMPTVTFPNHWSIATGLFPESHGIISNHMYDPRSGAHFHPPTVDPVWWHGEPIWKTLRRARCPRSHRRHGRGRRCRTAAIFWVGCNVRGQHPTHFRAYDGRVPYAARVDLAARMLRRRAADFVALYFERVDHAGHAHGPDSPAVDAEIARADAAVARLLAALGGPAAALATHNVVVLSDHGMAATAPARVAQLADVLPAAAVRRAVLVSPLGQFYPRNGSAPAAPRALAHRVRAAPRLRGVVRAFARADVPRRWHLARSPLLAPLVTLVPPGWEARRLRQWPVQGGDHGYDNAARDMQALFVAAGPAFRRGVQVAGLRAVDVYPMLCRVFGVAPSPNNGSLEVSLRSVLR